MIRRVILCGALASLCAIGLPASARAQTVGAGLSKLLTDQTSDPEGYVRDKPAAEATFATVASLFTIELTGIPVASSSGGFVYHFSRNLGTMERASDSFGPLFTERALRNGRGQASFGFTYQIANFTTLQGADLDVGTFPTNTARFASVLDPFSVDTLSLKLDVQTFTGFASYGITDRLDVGVVAPVTRLHFSGTRVNTYKGVSTLQAAQSDSTTGLGDLALNARYRVVGTTGAAGGGTGSGIAVGTDVRLPTGREEDLLGAGKSAFRLMGIGSLERGRFATDGNIGFGRGGTSDEFFWSGALTFTATPQLSVVGEILGRRFDDLHRVQAVYQPHPVLPGIETMRWLPTGGALNTSYLSVGGKFNLYGNLLLKANVLTRLTDTGLKARFTPSIAIDYARKF
jgi:hypothetical protein